MKREQIYISPVIKITQVKNDIITYSETEEWKGPEIGAGFPKSEPKVEQ